MQLPQTTGHREPTRRVGAGGSGGLFGEACPASLRQDGTPASPLRGASGRQTSGNQMAAVLRPRPPGRCTVAPALDAVSREGEGSPSPAPPWGGRESGRGCPNVPASPPGALEVLHMGNVL